MPILIIEFCRTHKRRKICRGSRQAGIFLITFRQERPPQRAGYNLRNQFRNKLLSTSPHVITRLLVDWARADQQALDKLAPLVCQELKRLAAGYLRRGRREHTLQSTAVVHEAWLRLIDQKQVEWQNRAQVLAWPPR